jgi:hypothetical protein
VDRLIDQHTSALARPLASPRVLRVVACSATPGEDRLCGLDRAKLTAIDHLLERLDRRVQAILENNADLALGIKP